MMRNKKELKSFLLNATRLIVLALCFVTVFAVALTSDIGGILGDGIAFAGRTYKDVKNEVTFGKANPIVADQGYATAENFGFPGNVTQWSYTMTYYNVVPYNNDQDDNDAANNTEIYKNDGDTKLFLGNGEAGKWDGGVTNGYSENNLYMVLNFDLGDFLNYVISTGYFNVTAEITANFNKNDQVNEMYTSAVAGPQVLTGQQAHALHNTGSSDYNYSFDTNSSNLTNHTSTVVLTSERNNLALAFGINYKWKATSRERYMAMSNVSVKITFSVNENGTSDGARPIVSNKYEGLENSYVKGTSGSGYAPYITDASDYGIYFDSIKKYVKTDKVADGSGTMASYTNTPLGTFQNTSYYKFAQTEYVDMFNKSGQSIEDAIAEYGTNANNYIGVGDKVLSVSGSSYSWSNASGEQYAKVTGIKTVQVGDTVFNLYDGTNAIATQTKAITVTDTDENTVSVGYATVTRTNRARVVVSIYFTTNCDIKTIVTDYGGLSETSTLKVSGIDTSIANEDTPMAEDDYIGATSPKEWIHSKQYENATDYNLTEDTSAYDYSPRLWFYTVDKASSMSGFGTAKTFANAQALLATGLLPLGVEDGFKLEYDFAVGKAKSRGVDVYDASGVIGTDGKVSSDTSSVTGYGYYRFTIYMMDLAGNLSNVTSTYYVKVDYDTPAHKIGLSYVDASGNTITISSANNGTWAKNDATLKVSFGADNDSVWNKLVGFSGLTLEFDDSYYTHTLTFAENLASLKTYHTTKGGDAVTVYNNTANITITTDAGDRTAVVKYNATDKTLSITVSNHDNGVEWITSLTAYTGQFANADVRSEYPGELKSSADGSWKGGVKVLIDNVAPVAPEFISGEDTPFSKDFYGDYTTLPAVSDRSWYLGMYDKYSASIAFDDVFLESAYSNDVKVFYGVNLVKNLAELQALGNKKIEEIYASINENSNYKDYFTRFTVIRGSNLAGGDTVLENGAMNIITGAGMRVIYTWAVDQAGNVSDLKTYYILADNTVYTLSTKVANNTVKDSSASILAKNADGTTTTSFSRGELATVVTTLGDDFVPFALNLTANSVTTKLIENYTPSRSWTLADSTYAEILNYDNDSEIAFTIDNADNLGTLDTNRRLSLEFAYRKVVSYTVTSTSIAYTSQQATVEMTFTDTASQNAFAYNWYKANNALDSAPVAIGAYQVEIFIPKDNVNYVTDNFTMDKDGNQVLEKINIEIVKGKIVVSAVASTSVYGADRTNVLTYTISGIANDEATLDSEGLTKDVLTLALKVVGTYSPTAFYNVGYYDIVAPNLANVSNYDVTFESAKHNITQRAINVYTQSEKKTYGDKDPQLHFGVLAEDLNFSTKDASEVLADLFATASYGTATKVDGYYVYNAGNRISRKSGENVGEYMFESDASQFDVNNNYRIIVQNAGSFKIEQRDVEIDVTGQFSVLKQGTTMNWDNVTLSYKLRSRDMFLADEIAQLVFLAIDKENGTTLSQFDETSYASATAYAIQLLENSGNANINITLKSGENNYVVYIAVPGTIIVKAKGEFNFVYGVKWDNNNITFSTDLFTVENDDDVDFDTITWSASINEMSYVSVGSYEVQFNGAVAMKGDTELNSKVIVENAIVNITPAVIVVRPTYNDSLTKTYGEEESVFGIGFEIATVNGEVIAKDGMYAYTPYVVLLGNVTGSYVRAKFDKNGNFVAFGSRYDGVLTDNNAYYGITANGAFSSDNINFVVSAQDCDVKLTIAPKAIDIHTKNLVGINKYYNGNTNVNYGNTSMYDLTNDLVLASDDVTLTALNMAYSTAGSKDVDTKANIIFQQFALTGNDSANYTLRYVVRDGNKEGIIVVGTAVEGEDATYLVEDVSVTISYLVDGEMDVIQILVAQIGIKKSDISIVKEYDGTNKLSIEDIIIAEKEEKDVNGNVISSTGSLVGANKILTESSNFASSKASDSYYLIKSFVITFEFGSSMEGKIKDYNEDDVTIQAVGNTVVLTVSNLRAKINKKQLKASAFASIEAVNRDYNASTLVDVNSTFADGALVTGDTADSVRVTIQGSVNDANVGNKIVSFVSASVSNANYEVDVNDLNNKFTNVQVEIAKARLIPNVTFNDKVYDDTADVVVTKKNGTDFTTVTYADNLQAELATIHMGAGVSYVLSNNGKADGNVVCDENGKELAHNVMVIGLTVTADDSAILDNYRIYGAIYNNGYQDINDVKDEEMTYEILGAVKVSKKVIKLITNDFQISDKVYDGTTKANITIDVPVDSADREGVLAKHKDILTITATGTFNSAKVGNNIKVTIPSDGIVLNAVEDAEGINNTIKNNYYLDKSAGAYANNITGTIIARPVTVSVDLGERTYNGNADIVKNNITYTFNGILANEIKNYSVKTSGGAYFSDKNVAYSIDAETNAVTILDKDGNVYNPTLTQNKGFDINYVLVYKTTVEDTARRADLVAYDDQDGNIVYYPSASDEIVGATGWYYTLKSASKYVLATSADSTHTDYIVGRYNVDGNDVYLLTDDFNGTCQTLAEPVTYLNGTGKILQRGATITSKSIEKVENTTAFTKVYDGTTKFNGVYGTDYVYTEAGIANILKGDDVSIASVTAEFDSANTTAMYVVFTASGINGKDAHNYTIAVKEGAGVTAYTARLSAQILPRTIDAELKDGTMVYGTDTVDVGGEIVYTMGENRNTVDGGTATNLLACVATGSDYLFYINFKQFLVEAGFINTIDADVNAQDEYIAQLVANTYNCVNGEYVKAEDGTVGEFFRLGGETRNQITSLPRPSVMFSSTKPIVGQYSRKYNLTGGKANNFKFNFVYSGNGNDGSSRIVVVKRDLYVHTAGINVNTVYAGAEQRVDVNYTGGVDIIPTLFIKDGKNYAPTVVLGVYNINDNTITPAGKYAKISADLKEYEYYVYYLAMPENMTSYDDFAPLANYNVIIADASTVKAIASTNGEGNTTYTFVNDFGTESMSASTATIVLPTLTGVKVATGADATFDYTYDKETEQGENKVYKVVTGVNASDIVTYFTMVDGVKVAKEARDAGTHTGNVNVKRFVKIDDNDPNGYYIEWESDKEVTIVINKIAPQLNASDYAVYYNGKVQSYPANSNIKVHEGVKGLLTNEYTVTYQAYKNNVWTAIDASDVKNAGNYRVVIALTEEFGKNHPNYRAHTVDDKGNETATLISKTVTFTVKKIDVKVTIDTSGYEASTQTTDTATLTTLTALYDAQKDYNAINYTVAMGNGYNNDSTIAISKSDMQLVFTKQANADGKVVTGSGKYSFTIGIVGDKASNYNLTGNAGVLQLTANNFDVSGGTVSVSGEGILANQLVVKEIVSDNAIGGDLNYVAIVEQYMPIITKEGNLKYDATVAAIVKMEFKCDGQTVELNGETATISVEIPSNVNDDMKGIALYTVTKDGGLKKLTDYKVNNGKIEYTTDYVSALVFVDINAPALETWKVVTIVVSVVLVVLIVVATVVGVILRKKQLKKLI